MLVLSRKKNESVVINENVTVTIVEIRGDKVRLGIEAPTEIPVHRQEIWLAIQRENAKNALGIQPMSLGSGLVISADA